MTPNPMEDKQKKLNENKGKIHAMLQVANSIESLCDYYQNLLKLSPQMTSVTLQALTNYRNQLKATINQLETENKKL